MQFYSVVLGLEVLGNPVGFLRGVAEGTKGIFYHPIEVEMLPFASLLHEVPYREQFWGLMNLLKVFHLEVENLSEGYWVSHAIIV